MRLQVNTEYRRVLYFVIQYLVGNHSDIIKKVRSESFPNGLGNNSVKLPIILWITKLWHGSICFLPGNEDDYYQKGAKAHRFLQPRFYQYR